MKHSIFNSDLNKYKKRTLSRESVIDTVETINTIEDDTIEYNKLITTITNDIHAHNVAEEEVNKLEDILIINKDKIATPEIITSDDIILTNESLRLTAKLLDGEHLLKQHLSNENLHASPSLALALSTEGVKEFLLAVVENIKNIFRKIIISIKKLYVNAVALLNNTKKLSSNLKRGLEETTKVSSSTATEETCKIINKGLGEITQLLTTGSTEIHDPSSEMISYLKMINDPIMVKEVQKVITVSANGIVNNINKNTIPAETSDKIYALLDNYINTVIHSNPLYGRILTSNALRSYEGRILPIKLYGSTFNYLELVKLDHDKDTNLKAMPTIRNISINLKIVDTNKLTYTIPPKESIIKILDAITTTTLESKTFTAYANASIEVANKMLDEMYKKVKSTESISTETKYVISKYTNICKATISHIALDAILTQINGTKAILRYCVAIGKYYQR